MLQIRKLSLSLEYPDEGHLHVSNYLDAIGYSCTNLETLKIELGYPPFHDSTIPERSIFRGIPLSKVRIFEFLAFGDLPMPLPFYNPFAIVPNVEELSLAGVSESDCFQDFTKALSLKKVSVLIANHGYTPDQNFSADLREHFPRNVALDVTV